LPAAGCTDCGSPMHVPPLCHILAHRRDRGHPCPAGTAGGRRVAHPAAADGV
jgi:hypothetical protein